MDAYFTWVNASGRKFSRSESVEKGIYLNQTSLCDKAYLALAFVPTVDVVSAFDDLMKSALFVENDDLLRDPSNYFEDNWMGRSAR